MLHELAIERPGDGLAREWPSLVVAEDVLEGRFLLDQGECEGLADSPLGGGEGDDPGLEEAFDSLSEVGSAVRA